MLLYYSGCCVWHVFFAGGRVSAAYCVHDRCFLCVLSGMFLSSCMFVWLASFGLYNYSLFIYTLSYILEFLKTMTLTITNVD